MALWGAYSVIEVVEDLGRARPLVGRHDEVDVAAPEPVERMVGHERGRDRERPELIAEGQAGLAILELGHRLPAVKARIANCDGILASGDDTAAATETGHGSSAHPEDGRRLPHPPGRR